ncbi:MAG: hypothetical protein AAF557_12210 [Pseudomonadota bacterium]
MDDTKITAKLPHLDVEMTRTEPSDGQPEVITLKMTATPSLEAFSDHLSKLPMMGPFGSPEMLAPWMSPATNPVMAWANMIQTAWAPFLPKTDLLDPPRKK